MFSTMSPWLVDVLLGTVYVLLLSAVAAVVWAAAMALRRRRADKCTPLGGTALTALCVCGATVVLMATTFLASPARPMLINAREYADGFWLRTGDMLIKTSAVLIIVAALLCAVCFLIAANKRQSC